MDVRRTTSGYDWRAGGDGGDHGVVIRVNHLRQAAMLVVIGALIAVGCGGDSALDAACDPVVQEELDPTWTVHLLPTAAEPDYLTDPPTSGPHYTAEPATGALDASLSDPEQVTTLESGVVLIQYRPGDLDDDEQARLRRLAGEAVAVAPDPDLPDAVVATAWVTKQSCSGLSVDQLTEFVEDHGGKGPAGGG
jgi:hypothetical protein